MNDRCTTATARRLREQGFPQPVPAPGQVWYLDDEAAIVLAVHSNGVSYCRGNCNYFERTDIFLSLFVYAPTAPDILRELGEDWTMIVAGGGFQIYKHFQDPQYIFPIAANENPAEACAEAWEVKQKAQ